MRLSGRHGSGKASFVHLVRCDHHRRGSILVIVLLLVGVIAALASAAAELQRGTYAAGIAFADGLRAESAMRSAIERTIAHAGERTAQLKGGIVLQEQATVTLEIRDEASRIDLNFAPKDLLAGLLRVVGLDEEGAGEQAGRIVAWRERKRSQEDQEEQPNAPSTRPMAPTGAAFPPHPFYHSAQVAEVDGIDRGLARAMMPYVTVASGRATVDPTTAGLSVLLAVPGMTPNVAAAMIRERDARPAVVDTLVRQVKDGGSYLARSPGVAARFFGRVAVAGRTERTFEVVIAVVSGDALPYRILSWDSSIMPPVR